MNEYVCLQACYRARTQLILIIIVTTINDIIEQQHTAVFLPGKSHEQRILAGYSLQGWKKSDMT